jgi:hypothetical protein
VGNDIFIGPFLGVDFGVEKWGSFCRKLQNFKKFMFWPPGSQRSIFDHFGPPGPPPRKLIFGLFFDQNLGGHFGIDFDDFLTSVFNNL